MFPHIRQIQRLEFEGASGGQSAQWEAGDGVNGIGTVDLEVFGEVGCDDRNVWE